MDGDAKMLILWKINFAMIAKFTVGCPFLLNLTYDKEVISEMGARSWMAHWTMGGPHQSSDNDQK